LKRRSLPVRYRARISRYHSAYDRFFLSDLGHIFVRTWEKAKDGKRVHDIFDAEGRFIGRIPLKPSGIEILKGNTTPSRRTRRLPVRQALRRDLEDPMTGRKRG